MSDKLFHKPSNGTIVVQNIDGNKEVVPIKKLKLRVGVYGILRNNDSILVQWNPLIQRYSIPGGGIELGEKINDALIREYYEETGITVKATKLINVKESFFVFREEYAHSILLFYEVEKVSGELSLHKKTSDSEKAEFIPLTEIKAENFSLPYKEILLSII